jgi:lysyl-tRNA synthetase class 2
MSWLHWLMTPRWLARLVIALGLVSVASALVPAWRSRLEVIAGVLPSLAPAAARAGAAAVGVLLVVLGRGLRRGKRRAWWMATILAGAGVVLHVAKGLDVEEALLAVLVLGLLIGGRRQFTAASDPRSGRTTAAVAAGAAMAGTALGWLLLALADHGQVPGTTPAQRLVQAAAGLVGVPGPVRFTTVAAATESAAALLVLGAAGLAAVLAVALRPAGGPHPLSAPEEERLRKLLTTHGAVDSLSYFSLRRDRSVLFSPTGKAAVSYRVVGSVSLAAGDPVGDPEAWPGAVQAWLQQARHYGWVPGVLAASERTATVYAREGLDALELGDEAIVDVTGFTLEGRAMRGVRQAVARTRRAGYQVRCDRVVDLRQAELHEVRAAATAWRDGPVERGFSMALGRLGDDADPSCVLVRAIDARGRLQGVLHLVPWGADGLSLDLMRRDRSAENGTVEAMVTGLLTDAHRLEVTRVSLNFAVFRAVFARGERLGAGPVLRLWRAVLLQASRFWQIESLYRANAKYHPEWVPRFVCFAEPGDLPAIVVAALRAEAFLTAPRWWRATSLWGTRAPRRTRGVGSPVRGP